MLYDIVKVEIVDTYTLRIYFENDVNGSINISDIIPFEGVFAKLKDPAFFRTVKVNRDLGTIVWDNGADISPSYLYSIISKKVA